MKKVQVGDENITLNFNAINVLTYLLKTLLNLLRKVNSQAEKSLDYGLAEEGVGLADSRGAIPEDVLDEIDEYIKENC